MKNAKEERLIMLVKRGNMEAWNELLKFWAEKKEQMLLVWGKK